MTTDTDDGKPEYRAGDPQELATYIKKSYQYIRISMVAVVGLILIAVLIASAAWPLWRTEFQSSISAYYYTSARPIFVASLVVVGVCLIALKGSTPREDTVLNLAGMMAPVVAFVPTPEFDVPKLCGFLSDVDSCKSGYWQRIYSDVWNNFLALLILAWLVFSFLLVLSFRASSRSRSWSRSNQIGLAVYGSVLIGYSLWFSLYRPSDEATYIDKRLASTDNKLWFGNAAHYLSAILLFLFVWIVVLFNARRQRLAVVRDSVNSRFIELRQAGPGEADAAKKAFEKSVKVAKIMQRRNGHPWRAVRRLALLVFVPRTTYSWVALAMVLCVAVFGGTALLVGGFIFWLELFLIIPFGIFWTLQTIEFSGSLPVQQEDELNEEWFDNQGWEELGRI